MELGHQGQNQFVWVVRQATCSPTSDTVSITYNLPPDVSIAGNDQQICGDSAQLSANLPLVGTGVWDLISGSGSFDIFFVSLVLFTKTSDYN